MYKSINKKLIRFVRRITALLLIVTFNTSMLVIPVQNASAQSVLNLPQPGVMVSLSTGYTPVIMAGLKVFPENPFRFDFIIDSGHSGLENEQLKDESSKVIKYFLASLTIPEKDLWVNLSPYEGERIIPSEFGLTEMGRDLLAQDYILKQITASLLNPENQLGQEFWARVYDKAYDRFGTTDIPVSTFNKVWIIPKKAVVYQHENIVFVIESELKVLLESDYKALRAHIADESFGLNASKEDSAKDVNDISSAIVREIIIPEIEKEVNEGKNFAPLRQIYHSIILAGWFKKNLRENILSKLYVEQNKIAGVNVDDETIKDKIYQQYLDAFKIGVYDYIREEYDPNTQSIIPRKYFSGGTLLSVIDGDRSMLEVKTDRVSAQRVSSKGKFFIAESEAIPQTPDRATIAEPPSRGLTEVIAKAVQESKNKYVDETLGTVVNINDILELTQTEEQRRELAKIIGDMHLASFPSDTDMTDVYLSNVFKRTKSGIALFVLVINNRIEGFFRTANGDKIQFLNFMHVNQEYRGEGRGEFLWMAILAEAIKSNAEKIGWASTAQATSYHLKFLKENGFEGSYTFTPAEGETMYDNFVLNLQDIALEDVDRAVLGVSNQRLKYLQTIYSTVNPNAEKKTALYVHAGADILTTILSTNAESVIMTDRLPFGERHPDDKKQLYRKLVNALNINPYASEERLEKASTKEDIAKHFEKDSAQGEDFISKFIHSHGGSLRELFLFDLDLLDINLDTVNIEKIDTTDSWKITFNWQHPDDTAPKERTVYFLGSRPTSQMDLSKLPEETALFIKANQGIDIFIEKAPNYYQRQLQGKTILWDDAFAEVNRINALKVNLLKEGGISIGDDELSSYLPLFDSFKFRSGANGSSNDRLLLSERSIEFERLTIPWKLIFYGFWNLWGNGTISLIKRTSGIPKLEPDAISQIEKDRATLNFSSSNIELNTILSEFLSTTPSPIMDAVGPYFLAHTPWRKNKRQPAKPYTFVLTPFHSDDFNFNKLPENEILWEGEITQGYPLSIVFQKWPYAPRHFLVVPQRTSNRPQILQQKDIKHALERVRQKPLPHYREAFNSLKAGASVNHLHFHGYEIPNGHSALEKSDLTLIKETEGATIHRLENYPANGILISAEDSTLAAQAAFAYIQTLQNLDIGHSVIFTPNGIYILPVKPNHITSFGNTWTFYELSGFVLNIFEGKEIQTLTERSIEEEMKSVSINTDFFLMTVETAFNTEPDRAMLTELKNKEIISDIGRLRNNLFNYSVYGTLPDNVEFLGDGFTRAALRDKSKFPNLVFKFPKYDKFSEDPNPNESANMAKAALRAGYEIITIDGVELIKIPGIAPFIYSGDVVIQQYGEPLENESETKSAEQLLTEHGLRWEKGSDFLKNIRKIDGEPSVIDNEDIIILDPELQWKDLEKEGYEIEFKQDKSDTSAPVILLGIVKKDGKVLYDPISDQDSYMEFHIFPDQKIIIIKHFFPNFPNKNSPDYVPQRGRALFKHIFSQQTYPGYRILADSASINLKNMFLSLTSYDPVIDPDAKTDIEAKAYYELKEGIEELIAELDSPHQQKALKEAVNSTDIYAQVSDRAVLNASETEYVPFEKLRFRDKTAIHGKFTVADRVLGQIGKGEFNETFDNGETIVRVRQRESMRTTINNENSPADILASATRLAELEIGPEVVSYGFTQDDFEEGHFYLEATKIIGQNAREINRPLTDDEVFLITEVLNELISNGIFIFDFIPSNIVLGHKSYESSNYYSAFFVDYDFVRIFSDEQKPTRQFLANRYLFFYEDFKKKKDPNWSWEQADPEGKIAQFLRSIINEESAEKDRAGLGYTSEDDLLFSTAKAKLAAQFRLDQTRQTIHSFKKSHPLWYWNNSTVVPWNELVRNPQIDRPNSDNRRNYWSNQAKLRAEFILFMESLINGSVPSLEEFKKWLIKMNKMTLTGYNNESLYFTEFMSVDEGLTRDETIKKKAGQFRNPDQVTDKYLQTLLNYLVEFARLTPSSDNTEKSIDIISNFYFFALNEIFPFINGNNSMFMNMVNGMLRLHGLTGIAHEDLDSHDEDTVNNPTKKIKEAIGKKNPYIRGKSKKSIIIADRATLTENNLPSSIEIELEVKNSSGIHARPSTMLLNLANQSLWSKNVIVSALGVNGNWIKISQGSILNMLMNLTYPQGEKIKIKVEAQPQGTADNVIKAAASVKLLIEDYQFFENNNYSNDPVGVIQNDLKDKTPDDMLAVIDRAELAEEAELTFMINPFYRSDGMKYLHDLFRNFASDYPEKVKDQQAVEEMLRSVHLFPVIPQGVDNRIDTSYISEYLTQYANENVKDPQLKSLYLTAAPILLQISQKIYRTLDTEKDHNLYLKDFTPDSFSIDYSLVAQRLKELRLKRSEKEGRTITAVDIEEATGVEQRGYRLLENAQIGEHPEAIQQELYIDTLLKFANYFGVSIDYLVEGKETPEGHQPYQIDNMGEVIWHNVELELNSRRVDRNLFYEKIGTDYNNYREMRYRKKRPAPSRLLLIAKALNISLDQVVRPYVEVGFYVKTTDTYQQSKLFPSRGSKELYESMGKRLVYLRTNRKLESKQIADMHPFLDKQYMTRIENGRGGDFGLAPVLTLANAYEVSLYYLLTGRNPAKKYFDKFDTDNLDEILKTNINHAFKESRMTRKELMAKTGLSPAQLTQILTGQRPPKMLERIIILAKALEMPVDLLFASKEQISEYMKNRPADLAESLESAYDSNNHFYKRTIDVTTLFDGTSRLKGTMAPQFPMPNGQLWKDDKKTDGAARIGIGIGQNLDKIEATVIKNNGADTSVVILTGYRLVEGKLELAGHAYFGVIDKKLLYVKKDGSETAYINELSEDEIKSEYVMIVLLELVDEGAFDEEDVDFIEAWLVDSLSDEELSNFLFNGENVDQLKTRLSRQLSEMGLFSVTEGRLTPWNYKKESPVDKAMLNLDQIVNEEIVGKKIAASSGQELSEEVIDSVIFLINVIIKNKIFIPDLNEKIIFGHKKGQTAKDDRAYVVTKEGAKKFKGSMEELAGMYLPMFEEWMEAGLDPFSTITSNLFEIVEGDIDLENDPMFSFSEEDPDRTESQAPSKPQYIEITEANIDTLKTDNKRIRLTYTPTLNGITADKKRTIEGSARKILGYIGILGDLTIIDKGETISISATGDGATFIHGIGGIQPTIEVLPDKEENETEEDDFPIEDDELDRAALGNKDLPLYSEFDLLVKNDNGIHLYPQTLILNVAMDMPWSKYIRISAKNSKGIWVILTNNGVRVNDFAELDETFPKGRPVTFRIETDDPIHREDILRMRASLTALIQENQFFEGEFKIEGDPIETIKNKTLEIPTDELLKMFSSDIDRASLSSFLSPYLNAEKLIVNELSQYPIQSQVSAAFEGMSPVEEHIVYDQNDPQEWWIHLHINYNNNPGVFNLRQGLLIKMQIQDQNIELYDVWIESWGKEESGFISIDAMVKRKKIPQSMADQILEQAKKAVEEKKSILLAAREQKLQPIYAVTPAKRSVRYMKNTLTADTDRATLAGKIQFSKPKYYEMRGTLIHSEKGDLPFIDSGAINEVFDNGKSVIRIHKKAGNNHSYYPQKISLIKKMGELGISPKWLEHGHTQNDSENGHFYAEVQKIIGYDLSQNSRALTEGELQKLLELLTILLKNKIYIADLKPENVMIGTIAGEEDIQKEKAYIVDFDEVRDRFDLSEARLAQLYIRGFRDYRERDLWNWITHDPDNKIIKFLESFSSGTFSDRSSLGKPENVGGIDLNPDYVDIEQKGTDIKFELPEKYRHYQNMDIQGFTPVIFQIIPVTNLPLLLGVSAEEKPFDSAQEDMKRKGLLAGV